MQGEKRCTSRVPVGEVYRNRTSAVNCVDESKILKLMLNRTHLAQVTENVADFREHGIEHSGS